LVQDSEDGIALKNLKNEFIKNITLKFTKKNVKRIT
jgi:hypothetical protein